ncbi:MAG: hypothetical protein DBW94_05175 [Gammaproteobacteria bacterium]|nr:MAG: hypothetical protein DBW94_05175 [Gammaproteobacteria bacterium]|tara:strand:- start:7418 stop:8026 length:609 start_codon:yes stop_codon:yes gene_type:complete
MGIINIGLIIILLISNLELEARPISYSGGSTLMAFSDNMRDSVYFHYSPSYKYSIGIESINDKFFDDKYSYMRFTYLLNRKNTQDSQRNLYFQSGFGANGLDKHFIGVHGDWETRRIFAGFGFKRILNKKEDFNDGYVQIGVAPYLGEYGDLHTWIMLKSKKDSLMDKWSTFPVLKFFKGNFLIELGYNEATEWDTHIMYRF